MGRYPFAKIGDGYVFRMHRVGVQSRTVAEDRNQPGIVRAGKSKHITTHGKVNDIGDQVRQPAKHGHMFFALTGRNVGPVLPHYNMSKHKGLLALTPFTSYAMAIIEHLLQPRDNNYRRH